MWYKSVTSLFGEVVLLWRDHAGSPRIQGVLLPNPENGRTPVPRDAAQDSCPQVDDLAASLARYLQGKAISFPLALLALDECSPFQQRVLIAEHGIPQGMVSTYGRIAAHLGLRGSGRAVGRALATNPFPLLIPCHRAIRADGRLGGYQGGLAMKRALLAMEGVRFAPDGRVLGASFYY